MINLKFSEKSVELDVDKITYFERLGEKRKVLVHGVDGEVIINATLRDIEDKLGKNFYKCHKNFLVNMNNIIDVNEEMNTIKMYNNEECAVGERHLNKLLRLLGTS